MPTALTTPFSRPRPPLNLKPERQAMGARVGWNGGLGGRAKKQGRGFMDFALLHGSLGFRMVGKRLNFKKYAQTQLGGG
jgi:hypothetical protein